MKSMRVSPGGLPIGTALVKQRVADAMAPGDHGSTFAGNPLVTAAADTVLDIIAQPAFLERVLSLGERLRSQLRQALAGNAHVKEVRGLGLITGIQLDVVSACFHFCDHWQLKINARRIWLCECQAERNGCLVITCQWCACAL